LEQFEKWVPPVRSTGGRRHPAHPAGGVSKKSEQAPGEGPLRERKLFLFVKRPLVRHPTRPTGGRIPEKHPTLLTGGRFPRGASRPPNERDVPPLFKPATHHLILIIFSKNQQKKKGRRGREERRGSGEALSTRRFGGIFSL
jgi:hypothetical protein